MNNWIAYGDVNPLEHGGVWQQQDIDNEYYYSVVILQKYNDEEKWFLSCCEVNMKCGWINWDAITSYTGLSVEEIQAHDVVSYYGESQFDGDWQNWHSEHNVKVELSSYGIEI